MKFGELSAKVFGAIIVGAVATLVACVISTAIGALTGWCVGVFYDDTLAKLANWAGLAGTEPWQLGAMLGFVSGFFRPTASTKSE